MSVLGTLDAIAVKAEAGLTGLKKCYSATGSGVSATIRPIPRGIDDGPVGVVWLGSAEMASGNAEFLVMDVTLDIWCPAEDAGWAYKTLAAYPDLARTTFRDDMDLSGQATRCQLVGWSDPASQEVNGRTFLILPLQLQVLIVRLAADATA